MLRTLLFQCIHKENRLYFRGIVSRLKVVSALMVAGGMLAAGQTASSGSGPGRNTPRFITAPSTKNLGPESPSTVIDVSLWLNLHDRAGFDSLYEELYSANSSHYHDWLKKADFVQKYAPTAAEAATVSKYLTSRGLKVTHVDENNLFVRAQGSVAAVSAAFHTSINRYQVNGSVYRANASDPVIGDAATAALVYSVAGLDNAQLTHPYARAVPKNLSNSGNINAALAVSASSGAGSIPSNCFTGPTSETVGTPGTYPYAVYSGNKYNSGNVGCGYTPAEIQTAYNLTALYKEGYDGTGQTVVIIDWCGSPTIQADANAFSSRFGLPPINSSNFQIIEYPTPSTCGSEDPEINIDVEWAHAIAPGAHIVLLVPPSATFVDIDEAQYYAEVNGLGNVISGSYGAEEIYVSPSELENQNLISEIGAVFGISANFSTGDNGDFTADVGLPPSISAPASSPYATSVGGVSLALTASNTIAWQTGWGTNEGLIASGSIFDPPLDFGFAFGSTGGPSALFSKPSYQVGVPGTMRQVPDISWLADPFTGGIIEITQPFVYPQVLTVYGGTSLACPMFSALWAIANQEAGTPLGQAAPYLYKMPKGTITDVVAVNSKTNVIDYVHTNPTHIDKFYSPSIAGPLENSYYNYVSAIWDYPLTQDTPYVVTFGTDSHLTVHAGWDNSTGLGTPNGKAFADYFNPAKH
jgi:subtilase family serine protease